MMAAYPPQPGMHPGMPPHGHPAMTPGGQPMTPAQMPQMGMPGGQGPGVPHVTQGGAVMAMQPGANGMGGPGMGAQHPGGQMAAMQAQMGGQSMAAMVPNAHALSHMNPQAAMQQQHLMQQQQQMAQANPHAAMQRHQQMLRQQQLAQMGIQPAMQGMTQQQLQQLQQQASLGMHPQSVQLPQHLQMQQIRLQQQQQAAQQQQGQQLQQQLAMQHANSQHSNQGGQQAPPNQQGNQPPNAQMRPQSRMANPNEQNQGGPQQGGQQPAQQVAQQQQQPGQQSQQQGQQQNPQQQSQQQQMNPQQMQLVAQARARQQMQMQMHQQMQQRQLQQNQQQGSGVFILKVMSLADQLSTFNKETGRDVGLWHAFVEKNFAAEGRLMHSFTYDNTLKTYEVLRPTIARYFYMYFDTPALSLRLHPEGGREIQMGPNRHQVAFHSATLAITYPSGVRLEMLGNLNVLFAPASDLIECFELHTTNTEEHIVRTEVERVLTAYSPTMGNKTSPKMTKNKIPKAQQKLQAQFEGLTIDRFPKAPTGSLGISARVQHFLEIGETMNVMSDLISFAQEKKMRPEEAMVALNAQYDSQSGPNPQQPNQQGNPQLNLPPNGVPMVNRTPSMQNMQMANAQGGNQFTSPNVANLNLPMQNGMPGGVNGSPHIANNPGLAPNMNMANAHTPSPHQGNMAAPAMMPQHSQQGTNSSAASANTSPQVNNKRRRSTIKMEIDGVGDDGNAANRVKPSPRMNKKTKPGGV